LVGRPGLPARLIRSGGTDRSSFSFCRPSARSLIFGLEVLNAIRHAIDQITLIPGNIDHFGECAGSALMRAGA